MKGNRQESYLSDEAIAKVLSVLQGSIQSLSAGQSDALWACLQTCLLSYPVWKGASLGKDSPPPNQLQLVQYVYVQSQVCTPAYNSFTTIESSPCYLPKNGNIPVRNAYHFLDPWNVPNSSMYTGLLRACFSFMRASNRCPFSPFLHAPTQQQHFLSLLH